MISFLKIARDGPALAQQPTEEEEEDGEGQPAVMEDPRPAHEAQGLGLNGADQREADPPLQSGMDQGQGGSRAGQSPTADRAPETEGPRHHARAGGRTLSRREVAEAVGVRR